VVGARNSRRPPWRIAKGQFAETDTPVPSLDTAASSEYALFVKDLAQCSVNILVGFSANEVYKIVCAIRSHPLSLIFGRVLRITTIRSVE